LVERLIGGDGRQAFELASSRTSRPSTASALPRAAPLSGWSRSWARRAGRPGPVPVHRDRAVRRAAAGVDRAGRLGLSDDRPAPARPGVARARAQPVRACPALALRPMQADRP